MTRTTAGLTFGLLGAFEAAVDGRPVKIAGRRPRAILAMLLLHPNQVVTTQQIIQGLWGDQPPRTARESVQYFVHRLRQMLPTAAAAPDRGMVETVGAGYRLRVAPDTIDSSRFVTLVDQARRLRDRGELEPAWNRFGEALGLWRGPALVDFAEHEFAAASAARLEALRVSGVEERLAVGLERGWHAELVGELEALVTEEPLRESARVLLMLALYRSGRQAEALEVYRDTRHLLVERSGLEPGEPLRRLERAILAQDPSLEVPAAPVVVSPGVAAEPGHAGPGQAGHAGDSGPDAESPAVAPAAAEVTGAAAARPSGVVEERKLVTVVVIGLGSPQDLDDPEDVRARGDAAQERIAALVARYGGTVLATTAGRVLAVFGARRSRAEDPERAVRAALEVGAAMQATGFAHAKAGVATGDALVIPAKDGMVAASGPHAPGDLAVVGEIVHAATALEAMAPPGGVVVGAATWRATRRLIRYLPMPPPTPLEQAAGVQAWQAVDPLARTGADVGDRASPVLVERDRELALLTDLLNRFLADQQPQLLTLVSEAGLGKTRLVGELGRMVDAAPELISWRVGHCQPFGEGAFLALAAVVKAHAGILDTDPREVAEAKLTQAVTRSAGDPAAAAPVTRQLQALLGPDPRHSHAPAPTQELVEGWRRFFALAAAERPMVVVLEDLQWADDALLDFVHDLVGEVGPVPLLVVATGRPELLHRRPGWGGGTRNSVTLSLAPLSPVGVEKLLDVLLAGEPVPGEARPALVAAAGGNPLYVEEYAGMLREREVGVEGGSLPVPETVQQLIAARVDSLPAQDKRALQDAAVIGETVWVGALAAVGGYDRAEAQAALERLVQRGYLRRIRASSVAGETEYSFRHALIRDAAYAQLLRSARADKHQRAAAWVQALSPDRTDALIGMAAHHYSQALSLTRAAGQPTAALTDQARLTLRVAGDRARALGALTEAAGYYQRALDLWPSPDPDRAELLFRLGEARSYGEHAGEDLLVQARDALEAAGRLERAQEADVLLALAARSRNDGVAAEAHLERALSRPTGPSPARAMALAARGVDLMIQDRHQEAIAAGREALRISQTLGTAYAEGLALEAIGGARLKRGDPGGEEELRRCISLLEQQRNPAVHYCRFDLAWGLWWLGDLTACAQATASGRRAAQEVGDGAVSWFDAVQAGLDYAAGRWDAVAAACERFLTTDHRPEDGYLRPWHLILQARIRLARDADTGGALTDAQEALAAAASGQDTRYRHIALALQGRVLLAAGDRERAAAVLAELAAELRADPERGCATPDLAVLVVDLDRPADLLPGRLPPTRWHQAVRAFAARDYSGAAQTYAAIGSMVDQRLAQSRSTGTPDA